jgi:hypothetical protein
MVCSYQAIVDAVALSWMLTQKLVLLPVILCLVNSETGVVAGYSVWLT